MGVLSKIIDALVGGKKSNKGPRLRQAERQAKRLGIDIEAARQKERLSEYGREEEKRRAKDGGAEARMKEQSRELHAFIYQGQVVTTPESSNVASFRYYHEQSILEVAYHGNFRHPPWHYWYMDVSKEEAIQFYKSPSYGGDEGVTKTSGVWNQLRIRGTKLGHKKVYSFVSGSMQPVGKWSESGELVTVMPSGDAMEPQWIRESALNPEVAERHAERGTAESEAKGYEVFEDPVTGKKFMKKVF